MSLRTRPRASVHKVKFGHYRARNERSGPPAVMMIMVVVMMVMAMAMHGDDDNQGK
jgi:hypothetical protein